jgi:multidrug efflux system outer membrane protein
MNLRALGYFFAMTLVTGCAVGPDYERPAVALPSSYAAPGGGAAVVGQQWWKLYADPTLDKLVAGALARNADIRLAVARIEEADANLREAGAAFLPGIDVGTSGTRSRVSSQTVTPPPPGIPAVRNNLRLTASTAFELDFWGRLRRTVEATRALALSSRYAHDVVTLTLAGLTTQTYFSLRSLDAQIAATSAALASREQTLDLIRRRASGGIASDLELNQAQASRADAATQLADLQRQRSLAEHQLGNLTGQIDLALPPSANLMSLPTPPIPPAGLPSTLLERRPDISQAEQQLIAANAQIGVARAAMLPTLSLTGNAGGESSGLSTLLKNGSRIWSLGFGLTLPVFDWGRLAARADASEARAHQSLAAYQKAAETAFREVADALSNLEQTAAAEVHLQQRTAAARDTLRLAQVRHDAGYSSYLEVLDAQRTTSDAELALVRNRQNRLSASVDLMKALGGGWSK